MPDYIRVMSVLLSPLVLREIVRLVDLELDISVLPDFQVQLLAFEGAILCNYSPSLQIKFIFDLASLDISIVAL